jgi:hypothetical protein
LVDDGTLEEILGMLKDGDREIIAPAAILLGSTGFPARGASDMLIGIIDSSDMSKEVDLYAAFIAARALGPIADAQHVPALLRIREEYVQSEEPSFLLVESLTRSIKMLEAAP